ncbi:MAG: hypothetical protein K6F74_05385 [Prevotella sp.]|nr:hypothetical protein [Prevotella sp.]
MTDKEAQTIYNNGYHKGMDDMDTRFRIGSIYANNGQKRHLRALQRLVRENDSYSDDYKRGYIEAIDMYIGVIEFSREVDKVAIRPTVEEQMRIVRNRLENRYRKAVESGRITHDDYTQITVCIEATYQELFEAGFNVGCGEIIGPQKITV